MKNSAFLLLLLVFTVMAMGCAGQDLAAAQPIGRGNVNLCVSEPDRADFWYTTDDSLWSSPGDGNSADRRIVTRFPACGNLSVTIWEEKPAGSALWSRVTLLTDDGIAHEGWLESSQLTTVRNESGTEWSGNYFSIIGRWYQVRRGNGTKIWYDFTPDGMFTFNYDMMGNRDNVQDRGSWEYLGNRSYRLVSNLSKEPGTYGNRIITLNPEGRSFPAGTVYPSDSTVGEEVVFSR